MGALAAMRTGIAISDEAGNLPSVLSQAWYAVATLADLGQHEVAAVLLGFDRGAAFTLVEIVTYTLGELDRLLAAT